MPVLNRALGFPSGPAPDAEVILKGEDTGVGANVGVLLTPHKKHSIGFSYRSKVQFYYEGNFTITGLSGISSWVLGQNYFTEFKSKLTLPPTAGIGYAFKPTDKWVLETNLQWTRWSTVKEDTVDYKEPNTTIRNVLNAGNPIEKDWENITKEQENIYNILKLETVSME